MSRLSSADLLNLWEQGGDRHPVDRGLLALGVAFPQSSFEELADLPVGRRDSALLELRCEMFGPRFEGYTDCPGCGARLEFVLDGASLTADRQLSAAQEAITVSGAHFRLPTSRDLARIAGSSNQEAAARQLLEMCRLPANGDMDSSVLRDWEDAQFSEVESCMAAADPGANTELAFACEVCGQHWEQTFDIVEFLWEEIEARAKRLLRDVHLLARSYAWSEREVLAMSDARRDVYLAMAQA